MVSTATTPAVTLDSTASMKARRVSSWVLAVRSAVVCSSSRSVIRLNAAASTWTSSSLSGISTRVEKSPSSIRPAALTSWPTGRTSRSASFSAVTIARPTMISAPRNKREIEAKLVGARALEQGAIVVEHLIGAVHLGTELRIEHARRVEIGV